MRLAPELKEAVERAASAKGMSQTMLLNRLVKWFDGENDLMQSIVLGQIKPDPELLRFALERGSTPPGETPGAKPKQARPHKAKSS